MSSSDSGHSSGGAELEDAENAPIIKKRKLSEEKVVESDSSANETEAGTSTPRMDAKHLQPIAEEQKEDDNQSLKFDENDIEDGLLSNAPTVDDFDAVLRQYDTPRLLDNALGTLAVLTCAVQNVVNANVENENLERKRKIDENLKAINNKLDLCVSKSEQNVTNDDDDTDTDVEQPDDSDPNKKDLPEN